MPKIPTIVRIVLEIKNCKECPRFFTTNEYSTDGFDYMEDWMCSETKPSRKIQGAVEWHEVDKIEVPKWCPCLLK